MTGETEAKQPNVLVVITDQQRADHVGFGGNGVVQTPALDALAARSVVFDRAYVANPVCSPNRSSILTGRMPSTHGVIFNDRALEWGAETFARRFRAAGYRTGLIGKSHLQLSVDRHLVPEAGLDAEVDGFDDENYRWEFAERFMGDDDPPMPDDYYGFGHVEFSTDHGTRMAGHHLRWAMAKGATLEECFPPMSAEAPGNRRSPRWWQIFQPTYEPELHSTAFVGARTRAFIDGAHATGEPWLCWMAFPDPHHPLTPPGEWFDRHDPADIELPSTFGDRLDGAPSYLRAIRNRAEAPLWPLPFGTDDPLLVQEAIAATYGMIEFIDHEVGRTLDHLASLGVADDTIVIFTSDHGDIMGDHSLMVKGNIHYQGVLRVPLAISAPGVEPGRAGGLASSLDLCPTLLDLCRVEGYRGIQGTSLRPLLEDPTVRVREHLLVEDDLPELVSQITGNPGHMRTLVTEDARYTRDSLGFEQLFDLAEDPDELHDRSKAEPERRAALATALVDEMMAVDDIGRGISKGRSG